MKRKIAVVMNRPRRKKVSANTTLYPIGSTNCARSGTEVSYGDDGIPGNSTYEQVLSDDRETDNSEVYVDLDCGNPTYFRT